MQKEKGGWVGAGLTGMGVVAHCVEGCPRKRKSVGKDLIQCYWVRYPMLCCWPVLSTHYLVFRETRRMRGNKSVLSIEMNRWRPKGSLEYSWAIQAYESGGCPLVWFSLKVIKMGLWSHQISDQLVTLPRFCGAVFNTQWEQQWEIVFILGICQVSLCPTVSVWSTVKLQSLIYIFHLAI